MAYRRTENVVRRLAARHDAIVTAAGRAASDGGMAAIQIAPVAARAGIAAGTVYRYFPGKTDLVGALIASVSERELAAVRQAAEAAPGPLSALAAALTTFAARALRNRRLAWAVLAEPVDADVDALRLEYRRARALVGALLEGLVGPLAPEAADDPGKARAAVQTLTLIALRGLGMVDARARGLVVQTALPALDESA